LVRKKGQLGKERRFYVALCFLPGPEASGPGM